MVPKKKKIETSYSHKTTCLVKIGGQEILENLRILQNVIEASFIN
jgi:hypothetical protein